MALWTPAELSNLTVWLDASDDSTITEVTGVSQWDSVSPATLAATQGTGSDQPTYSNANNTVSFDGSNDFMSVTSAPTTSADFTIAYLGTIPNAATFEPFIDGIDPGGRVIIDNNGSDQDYRYFQGSSIDTGVNVTAGPDVHLVQFNSSSSFFNKNGNVLSSGDNTGTAHLSNGMYICERSNGSSSHGAAVMNEFLIVDAVLSEEDYQKVEGYMAWKWDDLNGDTTLVTALPSDHPYKSEAPTIGAATVKTINGLAITA